MKINHEPILWWCPKCDIYFNRRRTWTGSAAHLKEHRPKGPTTAIWAQHGNTEWSKCGGIASPVREGPVLAAYLIGGMEAVFAMGLKVN